MPVDAAKDYLGRIAGGLRNCMHPRKDPVVITTTSDETGDRILLGRNVGNLAPGSIIADPPPLNYRRSCLAITYVTIYLYQSY